MDVDELMDKCHQQEREGDLAMALALCTSAVSKYRTLSQGYGGSLELVYFRSFKFPFYTVRVL